MLMTCNCYLLTNAMLIHSIDGNESVKLAGRYHYFKTITVHLLQILFLL